VAIEMSARRAELAIVMMGPAGSGKTTVGLALARRLNAPFLDGDSEHDADSIEKMRTGIPLSESDRGPWLRRLHHVMSEHLKAGRTIVVACSALRAVHRSILANDDPRIRFVYLRVPAVTLANRLANRTAHFAGVTLLPSQLATLEEPDDEIIVDGENPVDVQLAAIAAALGVPSDPAQQLADIDG
jgi:gluconokinase